MASSFIRVSKMFEVVLFLKPNLRVTPVTLPDPGVYCITLQDYEHTVHLGASWDQGSMN